MLNRGDSLCEQYEALRAQASGECPGIATPRGLALLLRRGMPDWMTAWSDCAPVTRTTAPMSTDDKGNRLLNSLHSEVAILLASMALQAQKEVQLC
jgi:hypothetical protein